MKFSLNELTDDYRMFAHSHPLSKVLLTDQEIVDFLNLLFFSYEVPQPGNGFATTLDTYIVSYEFIDHPDIIRYFNDYADYQFIGISSHGHFEIPYITIQENDLGRFPILAPLVGRVYQGEEAVSVENGQRYDYNIKYVHKPLYIQSKVKTT